MISLEDACKRYSLTSEEFASWERLIERHGIRGLRATPVSEGSNGANGGHAKRRSKRAAR